MNQGSAVVIAGCLCFTSGVLIGINLVRSSWLPAKNAQTALELQKKGQYVTIDSQGYLWGWDDKAKRSYKIEMKGPK